MFIEGFGTFLVGRRQSAGTFIAGDGTFVGGIKKAPSMVYLMGL
jgi:hypothetical protein